MARYCMFFLVLVLWRNARGGRVLGGTFAQHGQNDWEKALLDPRSFSLSSEQQASSVASGVPSFEVGDTNDVGSRNNIRTSLVRMIRNIQGASASFPVSAPTSGSGSGKVNAQGFPKKFLFSPAQNEQTAQDDERLNCAYPRRRNPSYRMRVPLKPPSPTNQIVHGSLGSTRDSLASQQDYKMNPSGNVAGFTSTSQTSPQTLTTQYDPAYRAPASNLVAPSQNLRIVPVPSQQGGSTFQSGWSATQGQTIQSSAGTPTQTQASSVLAPTLQTQPSNFVNLYHGLGAAPVQPQQGSSSSFQSGWSASQGGQSLAATQPMFQTQSSSLLPPSQGLASAPLASWQDGYSAQPSWSTSRGQSLAATQPMLQTQAANLVNPLQALGIAPLPSQQDSSSFQSRWSASQGQNIPSASGSTFQTQPTNLVASSQSLGTAPLPSQQDSSSFQSRWSALQPQNPAVPQPMPQTQTSTPVAPSQSLPSASLSSQQQGYGLQASWYATQGQSIPLATGPKLQTPVSNILGPSQSSPVPAEQGEYGFQSRWSAAAQGQSIPSVSQLGQFSSGLQSQSSSSPVAQQSWGLANSYTSTQTRGQSDQTSQAQFGYTAQSSGISMSSDIGSSGLYTTSAQSQDVQSSQFGALNQSPGVQTQSLYNPAFPSQDLASLYTSPLQIQARPDYLGAYWYLISSDGLMALQKENLGSQYNPAASIRFKSGAFGLLPQSQSALNKGGVQPSAIQPNSRLLASSRKAASPIATVASSQKIPSAA